MTSEQSAIAQRPGPSGSPGHALPSVSVIVPTYNGAGTLEPQLAALAAQAYAGSWEVLVVDNGSTDTTAELVRRWMAHVPQLRLVAAPERKSRSYACNVGARAACGDLLLFCDCDDLVSERWLAAFAEALIDHDFAAGALEVQQLNREAPRRPHPHPGPQRLALGFLPYAVGANMGISRRAFEAVGGFDEACRYSQDIDISWRLQLAGFPIVDAPEAMLHYRYPQNHKEYVRRMARYAIAHVWLYRQYRASGMPRTTRAQVLARYRRVLHGLRYMPRRTWEGRDVWLLEVAVSWGHMVGSLRYRCLYL